jgi:hypothetical protein
MLAIGAGTQKAVSPWRLASPSKRASSRALSRLAWRSKNLLSLPASARARSGFALGAAGFQLQGNAGGGDDLIGRHAAPQGQPAQQQAVKAWHPPGPARFASALVVGAGTAVPAAAAEAGDGGHAV